MESTRAVRPAPAGTPRPAGGPGAGRSRRGLDAGEERAALVRRGVAGAVLVLAAFGLFNVVAVEPFYAGDETAATNHALEVGSGRLPTFGERYPARIPGMTDSPTWTAVHPPLYYLLAAVPLRLGVASGHPVAGLWAARALTLALGAAAVVLVARLAAALLPARPGVAVAAAGLLALTTSFQQVAAFVYNDALSVLATTATLAVVVRTIRSGCDRRCTVLLALGAAVAAATRASGLEVAALAVLAATSALPAERSQPWRRKLPAAAGRAALVCGAVALATGWLYARNLARYGDVDGSTVALLDNPPGPSIWRNASSGRFWLDQYGQLWGYVTGMNPLEGWAAPVAFALLGAVLAGLALAAARWLRRGALVGTGGRRLGLAWLAMAAHAAAVALPVLSYFSRGAIPFARYFFPALPLLAVVAAAGLVALPGARRALPTVAAFLAAAAVSVAMTGVVLAEMAPEDATAGWVGQPAAALASAGVPYPGLVLAALAALLATGLWLLSTATVRLGAPDRDVLRA